MNLGFVQSLHFFTVQDRNTNTSNQLEYNEVLIGVRENIGDVCDDNNGEDDEPEALIEDDEDDQEELNCTVLEILVKTR